MRSNIVSIQLPIFSLFFLIAYIGYAIGINLNEFIFVRVDGLLPMPKFLNFPHSFWNPYVQSGYFSLLDPEYQSFYPLAYLLKLRANTFTFNLFYLLNIALTGFFLFCYLREINLHVGASILGGMSFMLSGFVAGHKMHTYLVSAAAWIPLILMFLERSFRPKSHRTLQLIYGAFTFALVILAGFPAVVVYGAIVISAYAFFRISFGNSFKENTPFDKLSLLSKSLLLIFIPGSALASIAIIPTIESFPLINRSQISFAQFSLGAWTLDALPMVLFPFFYGDIQHSSALYPSPYFGPLNLWEISWFIGVLPFSLFLYVFYIRKELPEARVWIAVFLLGLCLVSGSETPPLYKFFAENFPFFKPYLSMGRDIFFEWFASYNLFKLVTILLMGSVAYTVLLWLKRNPRYQFFFGVLGTLFIVLLGSPFLYRLLYHIPILNLFRVPARHLFEVNLAMSALSAIGFNYLIENRVESKILSSRLKKLSIVIAFLGVSFGSYYYLIVLPGIKNIAPNFPVVDLHLIIPIIAIGLTIFVLNGGARVWTSKYFLPAVMLLVFLDLFSFSRFHYNFPFNIDPRWDCLKIKSLENDTYNFRVSMGGDKIGLCGLLSIQGHNPIWFNHYVGMVDFEPSSKISDNPKLLENSNMLRLLSVKYLSDKKELLNQKPALKDFELIDERSEEALYMNKRFLPRFRFVKVLQRINSFSEAKDIVYSANFDPENVALLIGYTDKSLDNGLIIETQMEHDSIRIKANTEKEAFLVFSDSWHPGWRVFVDEKPAALEKPYAFQMGVHIFGQGEHLIEFRFEPTGYSVGKWVSLITLGLMICFVSYLWCRPHVFGLRRHSHT
jgi:hypothetical protein